MLFEWVQALPIFLNDMFNEFVAVLLSVTFVLAFGEVYLYVLDLFCLSQQKRLDEIVECASNSSGFAVVQTSLRVDACCYWQVIPQAVCSRHGLAVGANFVGLVKILMLICWPVSYPVGKVS